jgi:hypothetical protein
MEKIIIVVGGIFCAVVIFIILNFFNKKRIKAAVELKGGEVISITFSILPEKGFGNRYAMFYNVRYYDSEKKLQDKICMTGFFVGVFWMDE